MKVVTLRRENTRQLEEECRLFSRVIWAECKLVNNAWLRSWTYGNSARQHIVNNTWNGLGSISQTIYKPYSFVSIIRILQKFWVIWKFRLYVLISNTHVYYTRTHKQTPTHTQRHTLTRITKHTQRDTDTHTHTHTHTNKNRPSLTHELTLDFMYHYALEH